MTSPSRRGGHPAHLSVVRDDHDTVQPDHRDRLLPLLAHLDPVGQETADRVIETQRLSGGRVSAALMALRQAAEETDRSGQWDETVDAVRASFDELDLSGAEELSAPFLAVVHRDLIGAGTFTAEHYDALTGPWRTHVGRLHPEDESLGTGDAPLRPVCH